MNNFEQAESGNQKKWDEVAPVHAKAYEEIQLLRNNEEILDPRECEDIGDVDGKTLLHLQCHIGTDSLAWARKGARVTGVDFSKKSIEIAETLKYELGLEAEFIHSNIFDLPNVLNREFDFVYTSRGTICWLRELDEWAKIISRFLNKQGIFYILDSHPILNIFDGEKGDGLGIKLPYFHQVEPIKWEDFNDYADQDYQVKYPSFEWTWSISDIINALIRAGLIIESFNEYDTLFFKFFPNMELIERNCWVLPEYRDKIPMIFTLKARKP